MSLVQHVSSVEGIDHEPEPGDAGFADSASLFRLSRQTSNVTLRISYDPIPPIAYGAALDKTVSHVGGGGGAPEGAEKAPEPIAAYEVSSGKRIGEFLSPGGGFLWPSGGSNLFLP